MAKAPIPVHMFELAQAGSRYFFKRMLSTIPISLNKYEAFQIAFDPKDRQAVMQVYPLAYGYNRTTKIIIRMRQGVDGASIDLSITVKEANWFNPRQDVMGIEELERRTSSSVRVLVERYFKSRLELGESFGKLEWLLAHLNDSCTNMAQVRWTFPTILQLMKHGAELSNTRGVDGTIAKIEDLKYPRSMPIMPSGFRDLCDELSGLVTKASLYPREAESSSEVVLELASSGNIKFGHEWLDGQKSIMTIV